jgi:O-Antigen ligase
LSRRAYQTGAASKNGTTLDRVGLALGSCALGWMCAAAGLSGGSPVSRGLLVAAIAGALFAARVIASRGRGLVGGVVLSAVAAVFVWGALDGRSADPLGYGNASAALALQGVVAGITFALWASTAWVRVLSVACAATMAIIPFVLMAQAGAILVVLIVGSVLFIGSPAQVRTAIAAAGATFLIVLATTVALALTYDEGPPSSALRRLVEASLSERRLALWHDAISIMTDHPLSGVGPGRFPSVSLVARADADTRQAHNEFLQQGAEGGVLGLVLAVLVFLWGFARLYVVPTPDRLTYLGAAALAGLGIQATVDYVLHFPIVPIAAALLVGAAQVQPRRVEEMTGHEDPGSSTATIRRGEVHA